MTAQVRLTRMARALRQTRTGHHEDPSRSRGDILLAIERRRHRRHLAVRATTLLVALFVLSSAWAASDPGRRAALREIVQQWLSAAPKGGTVTGNAHRGARESATASSAVSAPMEPSAAQEDVTPGEIVPPPVALDPVPAPPDNASPPRAVPRAVPTSHRLNAKTTAAPVVAPAPPSKDDEDNRLYEIAHLAHFRRQDPALALSAWNAYLGAMPDGRFTTEARYNRALCLIRLGRTGEARAALEPFAAGQFGTYRAAEAQRLLTLLDAR